MKEQYSQLRSAKAQHNKQSEKDKRLTEKHRDDKNKQPLRTPEIKEPQRGSENKGVL